MKTVASTQAQLQSQEEKKWLTLHSKILPVRFYGLISIKIRAAKNMDLK